MLGARILFEVDRRCGVIERSTRQGTGLLRIMCHMPLACAKIVASQASKRGRGQGGDGGGALTG